MMKLSAKSGGEKGIRRHLPWITALAILLLLVLNVALAALLQVRALYLDLTPEGLYTLSDNMKKECDKLDAELTITFCDDPDRLLARAETRYIYVMATELASRYDNISVETYNLTLNPTALDKFRATSASTITADRVFVSSGERYRSYVASSFWVTNSEDASGGYWSFNGEYVMASAFFSLALVDSPVAYYVYNHGEKYFVPSNDTENAALLAASNEESSAFYELLLKAGLRVGYLDLSAVDEIPDDCALLIMDGPTQDLASASDMGAYYERSESEVLDRYLAKGNGALMLFKDPDATELTNLKQFAEKWGISYIDGSIVRDETSSLGDAASTPAALRNSKLISLYNMNESSYPYAIYKDISTIVPPPPVIVERSGAVKRYFAANGEVVSGNMEATYMYSNFLTSSSKARLWTIDGSHISGASDTYALAALTARKLVNSHTTEETTSYFFAAATTSLSDNTYLNAGSYANHDVMLALIRYVSGIDSYADIKLGSTSLNSENPGGKRLQNSEISNEDKLDPITGKQCHALSTEMRNFWTVTLVLVPVLAASIVGAIVCIRRKYL